MELVNKLENLVAGWLKPVPHLPKVATKWLGENVWWIAVIGLVASAISLLLAVIALFGLMALYGTVSVAYYVGPTYTTGAVVSAIVGIVLMVLEIALLGLAIKPLQLRQKKGWTTLFFLWLLSVVAIVINAIVSFSVIGFIITIIFGAIGVAIGGYFLFEIRGEYAHSEKSKGVKEAKK